MITRKKKTQNPIVDIVLRVKAKEIYNHVIQGQEMLNLSHLWFYYKEIL